MREEMTERFKGFRSGFVMLAGAPNAGKSTLLNRVLGEKVSITSRKAQTTRNRILGVLHREGAQLVFMDTPGVHRATQSLNLRMVEVALSAMGDADLILFMVDLKSSDPDAEGFVLEKLEKQPRPVVLALNKTDQVPAETVLRAIDRWRTVYPFRAVVPISAKHGNQVDALVEVMTGLLPEGPPFFPEDALTDMPERFIAAEMIREKVFRLTGEEIPYAAAVTVESFAEKEGMVHIHATIHVERDSQKAIVIGRGGAKLKQIGQAAREDMERMLGTRVFLRLFVRVQKNWSRDTRALRKFGY